MRMCRVSAVIIAAVICGAGLTACGTSGSNPSAVTSAPAANGSPTAAVSTPGGSPTSALTSAPASSATPTHSHSAAADPTSASAHPKSSPHTSSPASTSSGTHNFSVPAIAGENVVTGSGSYTKIGTARVKVTMCAKQTGSAFSVGAEALAYSASGASQNIGATILTGPGNTTCVSTIFVLYTAHLKVHDFIGGSGGTIVKTGPVLTLY
jgi:hypothetical protein